MRPSGGLRIASGWSSERGRRPANEDYAGIYLPGAGELARHGAVAAVADGVGGAKGGRVAAELTVRTFIDGYYAQPDTIGVPAAGARAMNGLNQWLRAQGKADAALQGMATTFTAAILQGRRAHVLHVGDSRAYHYSNGRLVRLTSDHVLPQPDLRHVLYRAVGIEDLIRLDHASVELAVHDRLLLVSDGVHGALDDRQIAALLAARGNAETDARRITAAALAAGSQDNASAVLIDILDLPAPDHDIITAGMAHLPIEAPPSAGDNVDGFRLEQLLADGRYARVFRAVDSQNGSDVVVKFPKPAVLAEPAMREAFVREALIGVRVASPFVGQVLAVGEERQGRLYTVMPFYRGETLADRLKKNGFIPLRQGLKIAVQLTRAVVALHRLGIIHRDIKPENVIVTEDGGLRLVDLGVARLPRIEDAPGVDIPGTPGYMAPEIYEGNRGDEQTDQFALGVTLARLFGGGFPYGEAEAFSRPRFGKFRPPSASRDDLPAWLDDVIARAVAVAPADRFGDAVEMLRALEGGPAIVSASPSRFRPLIERDPLRFWQIMSLLLAMALIISIASHV